MKMLRQIKQFLRAFKTNGFQYSVKGEDVTLELKDGKIQYHIMLCIPHHDKNWKKKYTDEAIELIMKVKSFDNEYWRTEISKDWTLLYYTPKKNEFGLRWIIERFNDHIYYTLEENDYKYEFSRLRG